MLEILKKTTPIPMDPIKFVFIEDEIAVYQHGNTTIYDMDLNKRFELPIYYNGFHDFIKKLPNGDYSFFKNIHDKDGQAKDTIYKVSKKSLENHNPIKFIDKENNRILAGFFKAGLIAIYDGDLNPIREVQLDKFEILKHFNPATKQVYTFDRKLGLVNLYEYPSFQKIKTFKVNKQNDKFEFSKDGKLFFNYGYVASNVLVNTETDKVRKVLFHPTNQRGYKEQYKTAHNFGTYKVIANADYTYLAATTHQNKAVIYDVINDKQLDLKIHEHYNYDKFKYPLGKYPFGNVTFEENRILANVRNDFTIWDYEGKLLAKQENVYIVQRHVSGRYFALIDDCMMEVKVL